MSTLATEVITSDRIESNAYADGFRDGQISTVKKQITSNTILFSDKTGYGCTQKMPVNADCMESIGLALQAIGSDVSGELSRAGSTGSE